MSQTRLRGPRSACRLQVRDGQLLICMQSSQMDDNEIQRWCCLAKGSSRVLNALE